MEMEDELGISSPRPITKTKEAEGPAAEEDIRRRRGRAGHEIVKFEKDDGA